MGFSGLLFAGLVHNRLRALLTLVAVAAAFATLGLLSSLWSGAEGIGRGAHGSARLVTLNKASFMQPLPLAHGARIRAAAGVRDLTHVTWVGAYLGEPKNSFAAFAVDVPSWLRLHTEYALDTATAAYFAGDLGAALVGRDLAQLHGWRVGDRITLASSIHVRGDGSRQWPLRIAAIVDDDQAQGSDFLVMHYAALNDARVLGRDSVGWFVILAAADTEAAAQVIDAAFANSPHPTNTVPERVFYRAFSAQFTELTTIVTLVGAAALAAVLVVVATTQAQAVLERQREFAIYKAVGFSGTRLFLLVVGETCALFAAGGLFGLAATALMVHLLSTQLPQLASSLHLPWQVWLAGMIVAPAIGVLAALVPAVRAARTPVALAASEG
jgi:putative ABC transport system permease protein